MMLRELRKKNNVLQKELVISLNKSHGCISNYEKGLRTPKIEELPFFAKALNCSIEELVLAIIETQQHCRAKEAHFE